MANFIISNGYSPCPLCELENYHVGANNMSAKFWHNAVGLEDKKQNKAHLRQAGKIDQGD